MQVHLGGHLSFYGPGRRSRFEIRVGDRHSLVEIVRQLGIPEAEIALAAVNRELVHLDEAFVADTDRVDLYPPTSGG